MRESAYRQVGPAVPVHTRSPALGAYSFGACRTKPGLRELLSAGEPLNPEIIETWREKTGLTIREGYGQTETCVLVGTFPGMKVKPSSMGKSAPGFEVDVIGVLDSCTGIGSAFLGFRRNSVSTRCSEVRQ